MEDIFKEIFLDIEPEKQSMNLRNVRKRLAGRIKENDINELCYLTQGRANNGNKEKLYSLISDEDRRVANNALWVLCMKLAYTMCRHHAELLHELTMALDMISSGSSPSIMTARKNIVKEMNKRS